MSQIPTTTTKEPTEQTDGGPHHGAGEKAGCAYRTGSKFRHLGARKAV